MKSGPEICIQFPLEKIVPKKTKTKRYETAKKNLGELSKKQKRTFAAYVFIYRKIKDRGKK